MVEIGRNYLPNVKAYYTATIIKTMWYWQTNRHTGRWNRIEKPEIDPHKYTQLFLTKEQKQFNEEERYSF